MTVRYLNWHQLRPQVSGGDQLPLVSVIMPCYNSAATLGVAAASVLNQSLTAIELIIVDDGSTDATSQIAEKLADQDARVKPFRQSRNGGQSTARNLAMDVARGIWVAPVDADDEIGRDRLRLLYEAGAAGNADFVADGVHFVGPRSRGTPAVLSVADPAGGVALPLSFETLITSDIPLNGQCSLGYLKPMMRRSFLNRCQLRYDEDLRFAEDFHLYAMALLCGARFLLHPECHYFYNQTPVSASRFSDALPALARYVLLSNKRLQSLDSACLHASVGTLLSGHRLRWLTVSWFNLFKAALRTRRPIEALRLLRRCPGGVPNAVAFMKDRGRTRRKPPGADRNVHRIAAIGKAFGYRR